MELGKPVYCLGYSPVRRSGTVELKAPPVIGKYGPSVFLVTVPCPLSLSPPHPPLSVCLCLSPSLSLLPHIFLSPPSLSTSLAIYLSLSPPFPSFPPLFLSPPPLSLLPPPPLFLPPSPSLALFPLSPSTSPLSPSFPPFDPPPPPSLSHRLDGLVVNVSASRVDDPGFESRLRRDFFGSSHTSDLALLLLSLLLSSSSLLSSSLLLFIIIIISSSSSIVVVVINTPRSSLLCRWVVTHSGLHT